MSSFIFGRAIGAVLTGEIAFSTDAFKVMLCTEEYKPNERHSKRSDVTNEVSGAGYVKGGADISVKVTSGKGSVDVMLGGATWKRSTITARKAVYYKSYGGGPEDDELVAVIDFGADIISTFGAFELTDSIIRVKS